MCANERVVAAERSFSQLERLKSFSGVEREEEEEAKKEKPRYRCNQEWCYKSFRPFIPLFAIAKQIYTVL